MGQRRHAERGKYPSARDLIIAEVSGEQTTDWPSPLLLHLSIRGRGEQGSARAHPPQKLHILPLHLYFLNSMCKIISFCTLISTCHSQTRSCSMSYIPHQHIPNSVCRVCLLQLLLVTLRDELCC